jgi:hypothetical protein
MNSRRAGLILGLVVVPLLIFAFRAAPDEENKLTIFTFSTPVEVPGVALGSGTYAFKLADTLSDRDIVQIFDKDRQHLYATVLGINDYTPQPSDKTIIRFSETTKGGPPAIKEWFYPGDQYGVEFVYPQKRAAELAKASNQPVPSMPSDLSSNITNPDDKNLQSAGVKGMADAPLKAEEPNGNEVELDEIIIAVPTKVPEGSNTTHDVNSD